jgi:hypothetical protein
MHDALKNHIDIYVNLQRAALWPEEQQEGN